MIDNMEQALEECRQYNKLGGLDDTVIAEIAHDFEIDVDELIEAWND